MSEYRSIDNIKRKVRENVLKTELKDASKNPLWQNFVAIFEEVADDKKVVIPFIACVKCSSVMSYDSAKGTGPANQRASPGHNASGPGPARPRKLSQCTPLIQSVAWFL